MNDINESTIGKYLKEEALMNRLLAKESCSKFSKAVIVSINTCEQYMIAVGNNNKKIKNKDRWNYCHHMTMLTLLGDNHYLPLLHTT